jgi:hypothetical protein
MADTPWAVAVEGDKEYKEYVRETELCLRSWGKKSKDAISECAPFQLIAQSPLITVETLSEAF